MKLDRLLIAIIGATLGSLVAIWWVRNYGFPALPAPTEPEQLGETPTWIRLD